VATRKGKYYHKNKRNEKELKPVEVDVRDNNVEQAYRILMKMMEEEGILDQVFEKRYYQKPSDRKRAKKKKAAYESRKTKNR
jgi:small subunit ribosomal protein S21